MSTRSNRSTSASFKHFMKSASFVGLRFWKETKAQAPVKPPPPPEAPRCSADTNVFTKMVWSSGFQMQSEHSKTSGPAASDGACHRDRAASSARSSPNGSSRTSMSSSTSSLSMPKAARADLTASKFLLTFCRVWSNTMPRSVRTTFHPRAAATNPERGTPPQPRAKARPLVRRRCSAVQPPAASSLSKSSGRAPGTSANTPEDVAASRPPPPRYSAITRSAYHSAPPVSAAPNMSRCTIEKRRQRNDPKVATTSASHSELKRARGPPRPALLLGLTSSSSSSSCPTRAGHQALS
mmetsp:Transcript_47704/g.120908  ORF Transcript_47704/g.120908 Transcript_47704/m.120908 type:complete len:295 (-) Transcript_47704:33-917(-)